MTLPDEKERDAIHNVVIGLIEYLGDRFSLLTTSASESQVRQWAAAYLARMRRLVIGIDILYEAQAPDLIGALLRMSVETWITGIWLISSGEDALKRLQTEHAIRWNAFVKKGNLPFELLPEVGGPQTPPLADMAKAVAAHLSEESRGVTEEVMWTYNLIQDGQSMGSIHAGLASVMGHYEQRDDRCVILNDRTEANDGFGDEVWIAHLLALFAQSIFLCFDLTSEIAEIDRWVEPLYQMMEKLNESAKLPGA